MGFSATTRETGEGGFSLEVESAERKLEPESAGEPKGSCGKGSLREPELGGADLSHAGHDAALERFGSVATHPGHEVRVEPVSG